MTTDHLFEILRQPLPAYYVSIVIMLVPVVRIFERAGFRPWWALLLAFPKVGYIFCAGVLALRRWPGLKEKSK
jgi:hypothetical protein